MAHGSENTQSKFTTGYCQLTFVLYFTMCRYLLKTFSQCLRKHKSVLFTTNFRHKQNYLLLLLSHQIYSCRGILLLPVEVTVALSTFSISPLRFVVPLPVESLHVAPAAPKQSIPRPQAPSQDLQQICRDLCLLWQV